MSGKFRMVLIDLDGTTLTEEKKITPRTQKILEHLDANGIPVVIATGRAIYSVRDLFRNISLHAPVIALNGSIIYEQIRGKVWDYTPIEEAFITDLLQNVTDQEYIDNLLFEGVGNYYVKKYDQDVQDSFVEYRHIPPMEIKPQRIYDPIINLLVRPKDRKDELHQWLKERYEGKIQFIKTTWHWLEGKREGVHKGSAMKKVAELYGLSLSEVVAFGDEWNDLEMLEEAGLAIAMENGSEAAKMRADLIAPSNDREGVAVMLEEIFADLLIETKYA